MNDAIRIPAVWPGPMEGVMHPVFLAAANQLHLAPVWLTPFYRVTAATPDRERLRAFLAPFAPERHPVHLQLSGYDAIQMAKTAALAAAELPVAGIDLNCGCPSRMVCSGGAGGALLRTPERFAEIIREVRQAVPPNLLFSVKMRVGWQDAAELPHLLALLLPPAVRPDLLILHFRTVKEQYRAISDGLERLTAALRLLQGQIPLIANGDVASAEDAEQFRSLPGVSGVMAARGWLRDPFLLRRIAGEPNLPDPETGRHRFWEALLAAGNDAPPREFHLGRKIELARWIWGGSHPVTQKLIRENAGSGR